MSGSLGKVRYWARGTLAAVGLALTPLSAMAAHAQSIETIDPDNGIDADLDQPAQEIPPAYESDPIENTWSYPEQAEPQQTVPPAQDYTGDPAAPAATVPAPENASVTYKEDDLIGAAEGVFGKGAEGLARLIEDLLEKQGEPNGYIVGREAGGAFIVGARYGSGTLFHKVEGKMPVYWTGPSIGFDAGANAGNTFVLVYNLYDTEELYERYPAGEGQAYVVGGMTASYLRKGDVVLIPIRVGAGLRLGVNAGYMKFSKKQRWLPF
ncbi:DUF1134 domain-containing protein [Altererythrobacter aurantiacus]|uniref:DUF1134 domain-containing protein n=1 Tax=Parapontixanthobacter aurantiacus TaxID=1463599 RepID=A0A844ZBS2_9SPHN|nr:DUF1134 domain-containing protein [Parapontixanthobacter aurantiacus]MXO84467.1 DUF1134 domain-containing protein [Parapontixanthobacter aurantiacus]